MKTRMFAVCAVIFLFCGVSYAGLSDGLVAYYPFNGNTIDESGNGNHGTVYGAALTMDRYGNPNSAYSFDGTTSYIEIPDSPNLRGQAHKLSISLWVKKNNDIESNFPFIRKGISCYVPGWQIAINNTLAQDMPSFMAWDGHIDSWRTTSRTQLYNNKWVHIVGTSDGYAASIYMDGIQVGTSYVNNKILIEETSSVTIGAAKQACGISHGFFYGVIDDIHIYNRALSEEEIKQIFTIGDITQCLSVAPSNQNVSNTSGSTTFSVSNTCGGTMPWTATVTSGSSWLSITSGASGTNSGTLNCSFTSNTSSSARTAIIRITASGATGSPVDVTVTQAPTPTPTPSPVPVLSVTPSILTVAKDAGTTSFSVSNTGTGTMPWTAAVTTGGSWLSITSGTSGTNSGNINCSFTANITSARTATIRVTATDATGSPKDVMVTQAGPTKLTISGSVKTSSGTTVSGVSITFSNGGGTTTTDGSGNYSLTVSYNYSGASTPSKTGYTFDPASKTYSNVTTDKTGENYTAAPLTNPIIGSNSIDGIDVVKITDMSGLLPDAGRVVTVRAWDKDGKEIPTSGYALPLSIINHGTTSIRGEDIEGRFPDGAPAAYTFSVESSKMFITNVNNSIDGAVRVPIIYSNGLSNFVSNSIGSRNTLKVTDMSGTIASGGIAITVTAWDATGKPIPESTSVEILKLYSHGTTSISGSSLPARFPTGTPITYEFTIASPKLVISNVKNSSDGTLNIPTVYTVGVSSFVANSIGFRNSIYISDFSGTLDIGGAAIKVRAWDASGTEISESESLSSYIISNYETVKINGAELASRFSSGSPMTYEFTVDSSKVVITNVKSSSDGSINIPTVYISGITNYTTNYVSDLNTIHITDMSGGIPTGGTSIAITARDADGNMIAESGSATALKLVNHGTATIEGDDLKNRFPGGVPVTYEFSIVSSNVIVTNVKMRIL